MNNTILDAEDIKWIEQFSLEQDMVEDVLDIIEICFIFSCHHIDQLYECGSLRNIYAHAISLIKDSGDGLEISFLGYCHGINKEESLTAFKKALEYCHNLRTLGHIEDQLLNHLQDDMNNLRKSLIRSPLGEAVEYVIAFSNRYRELRQQLAESAEI